MREYLLSLLAATLVISVLHILTPAGEGGGLYKHYRLLSALLLVCLLLSPLAGTLDVLQDIMDGSFRFPWEEEEGTPDYREELDAAMNDASQVYVAQLLTQTLETEFSIPAGELRCVIEWNPDGSKPTLVTLLLSGSAIWKDARAMQSFVEELLNCPCQSAIE